MDSPLELLRLVVEVLHRLVGLPGAPLEHVADAEADDDSSDDALLLPSAEALGQVLRGNDDFTHDYSFRVSSHYTTCKNCDFNGSPFRLPCNRFYPFLQYNHPSPVVGGA